VLAVQGGMDAKQAFFRIIDTCDMNRIIVIIGEGLHKIENDPEDDEDGKTEDEAPGGAGEIEKGIEQEHEE